MSEVVDPVDAAFLGAKVGYELFGEPLKPYSPSRKMAAQTMGMLYPRIGAAGKAQLDATGLYAGAQKDAMILLWLCTLEDKQPARRKGEPPSDDTWTPARAIGAPGPALEAALQWWEEVGLAEESRFAEGLEVFMRIASAVEETRFGVEVDGSTSQDDDSPNV